LNLTNPYCNDPNAVNYNWGFPGKPDNTICFYPSDLFEGTDPFYIDSIFQKDLSFTRRDSFSLSIARVDEFHILVAGFCDSNRSANWPATAAATYVATLDTVLGGIGPAFCRARDSTMGDTVTGTLTRDINITPYYDSVKMDSVYFVLHINFQVVSDTGTTLHMGTAYIRKR